MRTGASDSLSKGARALPAGSSMTSLLGQSPAEDELYCAVASSCRQLIPDLCHISLALIGGLDNLHFYSLREQPSTGHPYTVTLPIENTSAGLAAKFKWPIFTSKLGNRGLRRLDWLHLQKTMNAGSLMCIPIQALGRVLAVLSLASESPLGTCSFRKELETFAKILAPALSIRRQRSEARVVNGLLDRLYPVHIRERLHELQEPMRPPIPHEVTLALQEADSIYGAPLIKHNMPSSSISSCVPRPSWQSCEPLPSIVETSEQSSSSQESSSGAVRAQVIRSGEPAASSKRFSGVSAASDADGLQRYSISSTDCADARQQQDGLLGSGTADTSLTKFIGEAGSVAGSSHLNDFSEASKANGLQASCPPDPEDPVENSSDMSDASGGAVEEAVVSRYRSYVPGASGHHALSYLAQHLLTQGSKTAKLSTDDIVSTETAAKAFRTSDSSVQPASSSEHDKAGSTKESLACAEDECVMDSSKAVSKRVGGVYAPGLIMQAATVLLTAMSLLSTFCRCLPYGGPHGMLALVIAGSFLSLVAGLLMACPSLRPRRHSVLAGTRIMRTALFAGHLVMSPATAIVQPGMQLGMDSGAFLIAFGAFVCHVPYRQHVLTQLACFKLLVLADIVRALLQNATLGTSLACAAAQLLVGVVAPSLVLRQLEAARQVSKGCKKAAPT